MTMTIRGSGVMSSTGFAFQQAAQGITDAEAEPIFKYVAKWYRRNRARIPIDTGALQKSLCRRSDRMHFELATGQHLLYGSLLPQAVYQAHRIPKVSGAALTFITDQIAFNIWSKATGKWMGMK